MKFEQSELPTVARIIDRLELEGSAYLDTGDSAGGNALFWFAGCLSNAAGLSLDPYGKLADMIDPDNP